MLFVLNRWDKLGQLYVLIVLQHHCQNCNKLFIKTPNHGHYLCKQCNNLRLHPPASEATTTNEIDHYSLHILYHHQQLNVLQLLHYIYANDISKHIPCNIHTVIIGLIIISNITM
jgi:hypothetical protein